jgi:branched-chain amino acid transport system substrate-binding protein
MGAMTGEYAAYGTDGLASAQIAADEWNAKGGVLGRQITLEPGDTQGDATQAATLANKFVDSGIKAVIGPAFSLEAETTVPIFSTAKVVAVTWLADLLDPSGTPGYFRTSPREDTSALFGSRLILDYFKGKRVAIVDDGNPDSITTATILKDTLTKAGTTPVFTGAITPGQPDYSSTITQLKAPAVNPDVVYLAITSGVGVFRKQAQELGLNAKFIFGVASVEDTFSQLVGKLGVPSFQYTPVRTEDTKVRYDEFAKKFEAKTGRAIENLNEYAYDAANILFQAIEAAGSIEFDRLNAALKATKDYPGVTGRITFDASGSRGSEEFTVLEFKDDLTWQPIEVGFTTPR